MKEMLCMTCKVSDAWDKVKDDDQMLEIVFWHENQIVKSIKWDETDTPDAAKWLAMTGECRETMCFLYVNI